MEDLAQRDNPECILRLAKFLSAVSRPDQSLKNQVDVSVTLVFEEFPV